MAKVGIVMGSDSDLPVMRKAAEMLEKFGIGKSTERGDAYTDTTIIVSGGNQGLELACKAFCNEGDAVICEDPSFIGALNAFRSFNAHLAGIPLEDDGIDPQILEKTILAMRSCEERINAEMESR